jgi:hypothetical protein
VAGGMSADENGRTIEELARLFLRLSSDPARSTSLTLKLLREDTWREFTDLDLRVKRFDDFDQFCLKILRLHPEVLIDAAQSFPSNQHEIIDRIQELRR